jgi:anaerobic selenocysteine-containing dehydrogenase
LLKDQLKGEISMTPDMFSTQKIRCYCALCISRCGSIAVVENGRFVALEPDPSHPTGRAICAKGRAAPELVDHPDRLLYPLKRTRPKGDPDPGWQRISWDKALDLTASGLRKLAEESGPESVVFSIVSPSTSASTDAKIWIERLMRAFGSPNVSVAVELCGWGRWIALTDMYGVSLPGGVLPDLENAGCILFWGYNPNTAWLDHSVSTYAALKRGTRLIVVDPRQTGIAKKADLWLQVRPGSDGALALGIAHVMVERGWYDKPFIRDWTNGPLLVRSDNGRLLTERDLSVAGDDRRYVAWNEAQGRPTLYDPTLVSYEADSAGLALFGEFTISTLQGELLCRPAFDLAAELCRRYPPGQVEAICGVERDQVESAARLLWESRPVAYNAWSGLEMQSNATQTARTIGLLYALTGSFDAKGGNVILPSVPSGDVSGNEALSAEQRALALGLPDRPLGPGRFQQVTSEEIYRGILEQQPYAVRGLVGFGANLLLSHADGRRGREALASLDFYVHADLFMNPTAELADVVLPVASAFEREALRIGFEVSHDAQSLVQFRQLIAEPRGESRSDTEIVFDLACRLGLGAHFWDGDIEAAYRYQLGPSGISLDMLRENPGGVRVPLQARYRKYSEQKDGIAEGFATPTKKIELYSQTMLEHGYPPLPEYEEPLMSPNSRPDLAERFPLILTSAKHTLFCNSQHRALPSLRRKAMDPQVELHPAAAAERGISSGDWVHIETPEGSVRARARMNDTLKPNVVCGQHGWWQASSDIGAGGHDPFGPDGANLNLLIGNEANDPISGSVPHRAYLCQIRREE